MRFLFYTHSLVSDWNHGSAHFLRGVMRELAHRGHHAVALEPEDGWSRSNLVRTQGCYAVERFRKDFPELLSTSYGAGFPHEEWLSGADVVIVHEWTDPALVERIGRAGRAAPFTLLFHDTHHRAVTSAHDIAALGLEDYDGVLAFGAALADRYVRAGWGGRAFVWHEAADTALFRPLPRVSTSADLVFVGDWGDGERSAEIGEYLVEPARALGLGGTVHGVGYPARALAALASAGLSHQGFLANADVPRVFAAHRVTVHIPRRSHAESLPGIPAIGIFEALACGIPLVSAPWADREGLFRPGRDFLLARDGAEMRRHLEAILRDEALAASLAASGLETIRSRHSCAHRVDELFDILGRCGNRRAVDEIAAREAAQ